MNAAFCDDAPAEDPAYRAAVVKEFLQMCNSPSAIGDAMRVLVEAYTAAIQNKPERTEM